MDYRTIIENARNKGVTSEKVMWSSIALNPHFCEFSAKITL